MEAESLARALAVNRSLQELDYSKNKIGDNGIAHIATCSLDKHYLVTSLNILVAATYQIYQGVYQSLARALAVTNLVFTIIQLL